MIALNVFTAFLAQVFHSDVLMDDNTASIQVLANQSMIYTIFKMMIFGVVAEEILFRESLNESMIDFNLETIDGKETTLDQLLSSIETLPFMDERKIVIVKDFELLTKSKKKNFSDKDEKTFASHLENIPDTTILVFAVYGEVDKRKSIVNTISKNGIAYNCEKISDMELFKWTKKKFEKNNTMIDNAQIMYFIESTGYKDKNNEVNLCCPSRTAVSVKLTFILLNS